MRAIVAAFLLCLSACGGIVTWGNVYVASAPDSKSKVLVQQRGCFSDCAVQVVVKHGWSANQIAFKSDCTINFAHAAWERSIVSVFVDGGFCGPIEVAFDTRSGRRVDFKTTERWLKASIIKAYGVTSEELTANNGDVFAWASYPGDGVPRRSMEEFRRRYGR